MKLLIFLLLLSSTCFGQVRTDSARRSDRDSAYKYWQISKVYMDSAVEAHDKGNLLLMKYYARKQQEASSKSYKYAEKQ